ncbi:MAG: LysR family transcriptional regulator, partial [Boseongicola sp. SB0664_bin_43]|nr:LysR family transcriptional regulator [Boseongicola sp. SB0664_bin_43]
MQRRLLPLNALRAFAAVHETGGIRSAARALDVTHSSVSRHLRFLEDTLGVALIDRDQNQRQLRFTREGERLGQASGE